MQQPGPPTRPPVRHRLAARTALPALAAGVVLLLLAVVLGSDPLARAVPERVTQHAPVAALVGLPLMVLGLLALFLPRGDGRVEPRVVDSPVLDRWAAVNSPATKVPSHGTHGYGQTYAVDLVAEPADGSRPQFGAGAAMRPPQDFPAFGRPVLAPAAGRVVRACDGARDHLSRSSWAALAYLVVESAVRELGGVGRLLGNHVVVDLGDGSWCLVAHLRRGTVAVRPGDEVAAGQQLGECGNSGNSSEPHVHVQLMDHRRPVLATGLPLAFRDVVVGDRRGDLVPADGEVMELTRVAERPAGHPAP